MSWPPEMPQKQTYCLRRGGRREAVATGRQTALDGNGPGRHPAPVCPTALNEPQSREKVSEAWRPLIQLLQICWAALVLGCVCLGCGYHFAASSPVRLPEGMTKLYFEKLVNPSTEAWLEPRMRSEIRQELSRRGQVQWVEEVQAQGILQVDITRFSSSTKLEDAQGETVKSEVVLDVRARIFRGADRELIWRSGTITARKSYIGPEDGAQQREAQNDALELVVERLANRMSQTF